ncbi:MAG: winged helix-turn-helix domain-containing protein [Myxococcota bacterium]
MTAKTIRVMTGTVDLSAGVLRLASGGPVALTSREVGLLRYLAQRPGEDVSRDELQREVWGYADAVLTRAIDSAVSRLRDKIEVDPRDPRCLLTAHGEGYRLVRPDTPRAARPPLALEGGAIVDLDRLEVWRAGERHRLTSQEAALLESLAGAGGRLIEPAALCRGVLDGASRRALVQAISRLRQKIEADPRSPQALLSKRGKGYRLVLRPPAAEDDPFFEGREVGLRALQEAVASGGRIVTLVGPGGVGKSALVQAYLARRSPTAQMRQWRVVSLAEIDNIDDACEAIAREIGMERAPSDSRRALGAALDAMGALLLVLDGVERIVDALAERVQGWLKAAPLLRVLVTSMIPLPRLDGRIIRLAPLETDAPASRALLLAAATHADPTFSVSPDQEADITAIIEATGGLPLALELAGARLTLLGPAGLRARLDSALNVLRTRDPGRHPRHRSMRACLDVSWSMLPPSARDLLASLALYDVALSVDAVEAMGPGDGASLDDIELLVSRGLLQRNRRSGQLQFQMPPLVRAYSREKLEEQPGLKDGARQRQALYFRAGYDLLPDAPRETRTWHKTARRWRSYLTTLRAVTRWAAANGERQLAGQCGVVLGMLEERYGDPRRIKPILLPLIGQLSTSPKLQAQLLLRLGNAKADIAAILERAEAAAALSGSPRLLAEVRLQQVYYSYDSGDIEAQQDRIDALQALLAQESLPEYEASLLLFQLFDHLHMATHAQARPMGQRALALLVHVDAPMLAYRARRVLAYVCLHDRRPDLAEQHLHHGLTLCESMELPKAGIQVLLGRIQTIQGRLDEAEQILTLALQEAQRRGSRLTVMEALLELGRLAMVAERPEESWGWLESAKIEAEHLNRPRAHAALTGLEGLLHRRAGAIDDARAAMEHALSEMERLQSGAIAFSWAALLAPMLPREEGMALLDRMHARFPIPEPETDFLYHLARMQLLDTDEDAYHQSARCAQALLEAHRSMISPDFIADHRRLQQARG